jgi:hypothetical protein
MPTVVQFRRGTTAQNNSFTGAAGEISVDTSLGTIRVHNGIAGGNTLASIDAVQTLSNKTLSAPTVTGTLSSDGLINTTANVLVGGDLRVAGNLTVQGTTTTVNSTTLDVADLNITVAKGAGSAAAANGAGLTVDGAGATLLYTSTTDSWNVNKAFVSNSYINTSANISAAILNSGAINSTGLINTTGNILSTGLSVFGNTRIGSLATPGALHTIIGNVDVSGAGTEYFNIGGNIMAIQGSFGSINSTGFINTSGNVSAAIGSFDSITVRAAVTAIANGGTNGVGNIGASGATFNTVFAKATTAQYADLAEIYTSDQQYPGGTVVVFGGQAEVTQSHDSHDTRIAGVVSTNPAYLMNHDAVGVPVALQGRVPCRVLGPVSKGDRVVASHIAGVAQALDPLYYQPGCIIGKALQAIDSTDILIIEVVVGRL